MTLIIAAQKDMSQAQRIAKDYSNACFISPEYPNVLYGGISHVVIIGEHAEVRRRYQGIHPLTLIEAEESEDAGE